MAQAYPLQYFRLFIGDTNNVVSSSGSSLAPSKQAGSNNEKWYVNNKGSNVFQLVNVGTGKVLTASGSKVALANNSNSSSQNWKIEGVQKDYEGYYLYYKITSNADSTKSLLFTDGSGFSLTKYTGNIYQKYKLNLDGLQGFAANCKTNSGEKAGTIGGLLGSVV
jgi:pectin lyase